MYAAVVVLSLKYDDLVPSSLRTKERFEEKAGLKEGEKKEKKKSHRRLPPDAILCKRNHSSLPDHNSTERSHARVKHHQVKK